MKAPMLSYEPLPYFPSFKSISVQPYLWMNDMLDFIYTQENVQHV